MKWKILYEIRFHGMWETTIDAETKFEAIAKLYETTLGKIEIVRMQIV